jgi:uncharacterized protein
MTHPNEELLRTGYAAFGAGDMAAVQALFSDDISWHNSGSNAISGNFRGHDEVFAMFGRIMEVTDGTFRLDIHDILANDTHGVVLLTAHGTRDGQDVSVRETNVWDLDDGKATEFWDFAQDSVALDRLFG